MNASLLLRAGLRTSRRSLLALRAAAPPKWRFSSSATATATAPPLMSGVEDRPIIPVDMPIEFTREHQLQVAPLMRRLANLGAVRDMMDGSECVREEFHWPVGMSRMFQTPETLVYGALATVDDFPLIPLVFRWRSGCAPRHLHAVAYKASFKDPAQREKSAAMLVPGLTMVQYVGEGLKFNGTAGGGENTTVHPGVLAALLDDITARVTFSNAPDKATFTANLQMDYMEPVRGGSFVVMDAWVTMIEGRKTFVAAYLADALTGQILSSNLDDSANHPWLRQQHLDTVASSSQTSDRARPNDDSCDAGNALGILATTPMSSLHSRQHVAGTPDSVVLDRMLELESVIATVKSSLDNHASSYYSVASQIADNTIAETSDRESSDEHYTRIQEMIDSLIKDADLALHSNPGHCQLRPSYSDTPEAPSSRDPVVSPDQLSSVSTVFDEPLPPSAFKFDADYARKPVPATAHGYVMTAGSRSASKPSFKDSGYLSDLRPTRPASAHGSSMRLPRSRKQKPHVLASKSHAVRADPEEADAESDSEVGAMSSFTHHGRHASRQSRQYHRRRNSGSYSDRHTDTQWAGRHRSDTMDSFLSNSSETCVSPGSRMSREYRPPLSAQALYAPSHTVADRLRTPTRAFFGHGESGHYAESRMPPRLAAGCGPNVHQFPSLPQDDIYQQQLQQQWLDAEEKVEQSLRHHHYQAQFGEEYGPRSPSSPTVAGGQNNVPLIRRLRNSVTRAVLRSASFVDESINDDIVAYVDATRCTPIELGSGRPSSRVRSSTSISEVSTVVAGPLSGTVFAQCESPMDRTRGTLNSGSPMQLDGMRWDNHARVQQVDARNFVPRSLPSVSRSPSLWTRRNFGTEQVHGSPSISDLQVNRDYRAAALPAQVPGTIDSRIRLPDSIEEYNSSCEGKAVQESAAGSGRGVVLHSADDNGASGLVSMISLLYWTLLFTLGALMLDSFLCQVAGKRVMGTVDKIAQLEANGGDSERNDEARNRRPSTRAIAGDGTNVANTVGRFVRWYIEGPEEPLPSAPSVARTPAHLLRVRKSQSLRGTFKHIE
ncbi:hypothetical protein IWW37_000069 [Coemansia sp. RSA 2050]|nr:hypothetical protein IWW37_000069 [Coemansia sp. RSA 2050]